MHQRTWLSIWTWMIVCIAVASRVAAVFVLKSPWIPRSTYEHGEIAANLLAGRGFSTTFLGAFGPTSQQAPVYPLLVAGAYAIGGVETPLALAIIQVGQAALGGLMVWGTIKLARLTIPRGSGIALLAGLIAALHPTLIYAATHVQVVSLATALLIWLLVAGEIAAREMRPSNLIICGVLLGLLVLTDPILGLAVVSVGWIFVSRRGTRAATRALAMIFLVGGIVNVPWLIRNWRVHGEPMLVKSTFGYAFWQGNCALSRGTDKVVRRSVERKLAEPATSWPDQNQALWEARHEAGYIDDIALTPADKLMLGRLTEPDRSRLLMARALDDLSREPGRYARLCADRVRYFWLFDETNPKARHSLYRIAHFLLVVGSLLGLIVMRSQLHRLVPGVALVVGLTVFHSLTIVSARFHVPIEPILGIWMAAGANCLLPLQQVSRNTRTAHTSHNRRKAFAVDQPRVPTVS